MFLRVADHVCRPPPFPSQPHAVKEGDDDVEEFRKRMMLAYRFRPNPMVRE